MGEDSVAGSAARPLRAVTDRLRAPALRLSLRAAVCLSAPLLFSLRPSWKVDGVLVALGSLWAISQDGLDEWRGRVRRLLGVSVAAALGMGVGAAVAGPTSNHPTRLILTTVVAGVAGVLEASGWPAAGSYLLVGVIVGAGIAGPTNAVTMALLVGLGGLWVTAVAIVMDRRSRIADRRAATAAAYDALADLFDAVDTDHFEQSRDRCVRLLDDARDVVGARVARDPAGPGIRRVLTIGLQLGEAVSVLAARHARAPGVADALRESADALVAGGPDPTLARLALLRESLAGDSPFATALSGALVARDPDLASPLTTGRRARRLPFADQVRSGVLLASACAVATAISFSLGSHGFWLPLAVAFIFRPDLGPVVSRALARTTGTIAGVAIAALLSVVNSPPLALIALSCLMAMTVPWAARRSHTLTVIAFTPIVFVLIGAVGPDSGGLLAARVIDTALGAVIVLTADLLAWSRAPSRRPEHLLDVAERRVDLYEETPVDADALERHARRRTALRALADARAVIASTRVEPRAQRRAEEGAEERLADMVARLDARSAKQFT